MNFPVQEDWHAATQSAFQLAQGALHVWRFRLTAGEPERESLAEYLSDDERQRVQRFLFDEHRYRFLVCRGKQRVILSRYLDQPAGKIGFDYAELGKPTISAGSGRQLVQFNVSNSKEFALCAITRGIELGVDVEEVRGMKDMLSLAKRFFAASELDELTGLTGDARSVAFFELWTCKEAILKAVGKGLSFPLNRVVISPSPRRVTQFGDDPQEAARWHLLQLSPAPGYTAVVASRFQPRELCRWDYDRGGDSMRAAESPSPLRRS